MDLADLALFIDLDGTLAPIEPDPARVGPDARRRLVLDRAQSALEGRLAIISGRTIADLDRILERRVPALAGLHGLERRSAAGHVTRAEAPAGMRAARDETRSFAAVHPGVMLEDKHLSLALHYRAAPVHAAACEAFAAAIAARCRLVVQHGKMVVEIRARGADKGDAILAFLAEAPFDGAAPIFIGDDLTDERGFEAAHARGGAGILVGPARRTAARLRLDDVAAVFAWLEAGLAAGAFDLNGSRAWDV